MKRIRGTLSITNWNDTPLDNEMQISYVNNTLLSYHQETQAMNFEGSQRIHGRGVSLSLRQLKLKPKIMSKILSFGEVQRFPCCIANYASSFCTRDNSSQR